MFDDLKQRKFHFHATLPSRRPAAPSGISSELSREEKNAKLDKAALDTYAKQASDRIDAEIAVDRSQAIEASRAEATLLLLGPAQSGKSTLKLQYRLQFDRKRVDQERPILRLVIILSIIESIDFMLTTLEDDARLRARSMDNLASQSKENSQTAIRRLRFRPLFALGSDLAREIGAVDLSLSTVGQHMLPGADLWSRTSSPALSASTSSASPTSPTFPSGPTWIGRRASDLRTFKVIPSRFQNAMTAMQDPDTSLTRSRSGKTDPAALLSGYQNEIISLMLDFRTKATAVEQCHLPAARYYLTDSSAFFLDALDRVSSPGWLPEDSDLLRIRVATVGIDEVKLRVNSMTYRLCDIAGSRGCPKTWSKFFDSASLIIFVCSLSTFDEVMLVEDEKRVNKLEDALNTFTEVCQSKLLENCDFALFLNKLDLLKAKLKARKHPIKRNWPKYDQPSDSPEGVSTFFKQTFRERFRRANRALQASRTLHVYTTCALDSRSMKVVISAIEDSILRKALKTVDFF